MADHLKTVTGKLLCHCHIFSVEKYCVSVIPQNQLICVTTSSCIPLRKSAYRAAEGFRDFSDKPLFAAFKIRIIPR